MSRIHFICVWLLLLCTVNSHYSCKAGEENKKGTTRRSYQAWQNRLEEPVGYINDFEGIFSEQERKTLDSLLQQFEKRTTIQIAVITIKSSMTPIDSMDLFTRKIGQGWGVGQKDKNNGVVVGISRVYRRIRIENGYGIEKILSDAETQIIIDSCFIPAFRKAEYYSGALTGLNALMQILEKRYQ